MNELYPWLEKDFARISNAISHSHHHAWLILSPRDTGKLNLATFLAQRLLCSQPLASNQPCNHCTSCQLFAAGNHPDFHLVNDMDGDKPQLAIKIDQIRELAAELATTPQIAAKKLVLLYPAEKMNTEAANSFLKTLEEPPGDTLFILLCNQPYGLPATILSRCIKQRIQHIEKDKVMSWLQQKQNDAQQCAMAWQLSAHIPLKAANLLEGETMKQRLACFALFEKICRKQESIGALANWQEKNKIPLQQVLEWLLSWLNDLCKLAMNVADKQQIINCDLAPALQQAVEEQWIKHPFEQQQRLEKIMVMDQNSLNDRLLLDDIMANLVMN